MRSNEFNQGISLKVYAIKKPKADKTNALYLRVIIDRLKREYNLKVSWPIAHFDEAKQLALPRFAKDTDAEQVNMVINEAKGRANRIKLMYFADSKHLSLDVFTKEFENYESRDNFLKYWDEKINQVMNDGAIIEATAVRHRTNLSRFKNFAKDNRFFSMGDLTPDLVQRYKKYLTKLLAYNTVVGALKCLQTYINHARIDGYRIDDPFGKISLNYQAGTERDALEIDEIKALQALFQKDDLSATGREVLRKFLFSCFTGLRISDSANVHTNSAICTIKNNVMRIKLVKGKRFGKEVTLMLPKYAQQLIAGRKGLIFQQIPDSKCNEWLKTIAGACDPPIDKVLSFHVSRDTFATTFIAMGGDVYTLKELLGQSDIKTTSIYVKMSENRKGKLMDNFNHL